MCARSKKNILFSLATNCQPWQNPFELPSAWQVLCGATAPNPTHERSVQLDPSIATALRRVYAQSRPKTRSFFLSYSPQDQCSYRHSPRSRGGAACGSRLSFWNLPLYVLPVNLEMVKSVEQNVRVSESIPATVRLIDGRVKIGLKLHELE